jgi:hypothetical protein
MRTTLVIAIAVVTLAGCVTEPQPLKIGTQAAAIEAARRLCSDEPGNWTAEFGNGVWWLELPNKDGHGNDVVAEIWAEDGSLRSCEIAVIATG